MARRPSAKKKFDADKIEDLNLVPIMNLVVCLIPMVLFGTSLVKIGVVNVNAPRFGMGQAAPDDSEEKPLNLTVGIEEAGFRLKAGGADIYQVLGLAPEMAADPAAAAAGLPPQGGFLIAKKGEVYDYVDLYNKLVTIKTAFPQETIVNLTAEQKIPFKYVISVMDVIRLKLDQDSYGDSTAFVAAQYKYGSDGQIELLWPDVVFAVAQ
ncbi:MAG: biopolymer transporter ExbD [Myxococcales bacterium]|nr:biopolymer transporter ExbD [Myxococcales bacterium]